MDICKKKPWKAPLVHPQANIEDNSSCKLSLDKRTRQVKQADSALDRTIIIRTDNLCALVKYKALRKLCFLGIFGANLSVIRQRL